MEQVVRKLPQSVQKIVKFKAYHYCIQVIGLILGEDTSYLFVYVIALS